MTSLNLGEHLLRQYPIALDILNRWMDSEKLEKLSDDDDVFNIIFPRLDSLSVEDFNKLRDDRQFILMTAKMFKIYMMYLGLYFDGTNLQIINDSTYMSHLVKGGANKKEHIRAVQIIKFFDRLGLIFQRNALWNQLVFISKVYPHFLSEKDYVSKYINPADFYT